MTKGILNSGAAAWAFEAHAAALADVLWVEVGASPFEQNYLLAWDGELQSIQSFVPMEGIRIAMDKRLQAEVFQKAGVPIPETHLLANEGEVRRVMGNDKDHKWVLKYPQSCGAAGHKMLQTGESIPEDWPKPYLLQEFIHMDAPEVYRLYCVGGEFFGWNARRFPEGTKPSPWVAHARGARYVHLEGAPEEAKLAAEAALKAARLFESFGVVDLLPSKRGWLILEVGTDGLFNHVDRDVDNRQLTDEIDKRLAESFWKDTPAKPWGDGQWRRRSLGI